MEIDFACGGSGGEKCAADSSTYTSGPFQFTQVTWTPIQPGFSCTWTSTLIACGSPASTAGPMGTLRATYKAPATLAPGAYVLHTTGGGPTPQIEVTPSSPVAALEVTQTPTVVPAGSPAPNLDGANSTLATITNVGSSPVQNIRFAENPPAPFEIDTTAPMPPGCLPDPDELVCNIPSLNPGQSTTLTFWVKNPETTPSGWVDVDFDVSSFSPPVQDDGSSTMYSYNGPATVTQSWPSTVYTGLPSEATITVSKLPSGTAVATLTDAFPSALGVTGASVSEGQCAGPPAPLKCVLSPESDGEVTITVQFTPTGAPGTTVANTAQLVGQTTNNANVASIRLSSGYSFWPVGAYPAGSSLTANGSTLEMQPDGNSVLTDKSGSVQWASNTSQNPGAYARMQPDGNLVVYSQSGTVLWASGTYDQGFDQQPGDQYSVTLGTAAGDKGTNMYVVDASVGVVLFDSARVKPKWTPNTPPSAGPWTQAFPYSGFGPPYWVVGKYPAGSSLRLGGNKLTMQDNGQLLYSNNMGSSLWQTPTIGTGNYLRVQDDGNLVVYSSADAPLWSSNSGRGSATQVGDLILVGLGALDGQPGPYLFIYDQTMNSVLTRLASPN